MCLNSTKSDFKKFDSDLKIRWKTISRSVCRLSKDCDEDKGYDIYSRTIDFKARLVGIQTEEYYITRGSYQRLSNQKQVGWHPMWKEKIK